MKLLKIKQKKNNLDKVISSSFLALFVVVFFYMYQNINIVFNMVDYKKSINKINESEKNLLAISNDIVDYKKKLSLTTEYGNNLKKYQGKNSLVRKDVSSNLTLLYDVR